mgnify:CR=1 FL=1
MASHSTTLLRRARPVGACGTWAGSIDGRPHVESVEMAEERERVGVLQGPRQAETAAAILGHVPLGVAGAADR